MNRALKLASLLMTLILMPAATQAQLSCDNPPAPFNEAGVLANWQSVWNLTDVCRSADGIFFEIISGGVGRDGIPPIDNPQFDDLETADQWLQAASPVIAVEVEGIARAYPLAILTRHEIANDMIGETPIAVTFCPLCNSAIVYNRQVGDVTLRFGVSGLLRNSDLIMWDDLTQSFWQQLTGEGIVGEYTGTLLDIVASQLVGYGAFKDQYPDGEVLSAQGRFYGTNPYAGYDRSTSPFLFNGTLDPRLPATERVMGLALDDKSIAYPFGLLSEEFVVNDSFAGQDIVIIWRPGAYSALDAARIDESYDAGMGAIFSREIDGTMLTFGFKDDQIVDNETGSAWNIFGSAISGELAGSQLEALNAFPHFWFAWAAFYPETEVYGSESGD